MFPGPSDRRYSSRVSRKDIGATTTWERQGRTGLGLGCLVISACRALTERVALPTWLLAWDEGC